jgi:hypothetical protein
MAFSKMLAQTRRCLDETRRTACASYVYGWLGRAYETKLGFLLFSEAVYRSIRESLWRALYHTSRSCFTIPSISQLIALDKKASNFMHHVACGASIVHSCCAARCNVPRPIHKRRVFLPHEDHITLACPYKTIIRDTLYTSLACMYRLIPFCRHLGPHVATSLDFCTQSGPCRRPITSVKLARHIKHARLVIFHITLRLENGHLLYS